MQNKEMLKHCPFCGGKAAIVVSDHEGNLRDEEYEKNPCSGLSFKIRHAHEENKGCPIATFDEDDATMGVYLYDSRNEAIQAWNLRKEKGINIQKYYVFYNSDNAPVDAIEGFDCDLENYISEMNKKGFRAEEVSYLKYKRIRDRMLPSRQLLNFIFGGFIIAIIIVIVTSY